MNIGTLLGIIPLLGVLAGLARARFPRAPFVVAGLVVTAYALYMAAVGIFAAQCWDCRGGLGTTRGDGFIASAIFFGLIAVTTLIGIWLGARLATVLGRLLRTFRELREFRRPPAEGNSDVS